MFVIKAILVAAYMFIILFWFKPAKSIFLDAPSCVTRTKPSHFYLSPLTNNWPVFMITEPRPVANKILSVYVRLTPTSILITGTFAVLERNEIRTSKPNEICLKWFPVPLDQKEKKISHDWSRPSRSGSFLLYKSTSSSSLCTISVTTTWFIAIHEKRTHMCPTESCCMWLVFSYNTDIFAKCAGSSILQCI